MDVERARMQVNGAQQAREEREPSSGNHDRQAATEASDDDHDHQA